MGSERRDRSGIGQLMFDWRARADDTKLREIDEKNKDSC